MKKLAILLSVLAPLAEARIASLRGEVDAAHALAEQALPLARRAGSPRLEAEVLGTLSELHAKRGQPREALRAFEDAIRVSPNLTGPREEAALLYQAQGRPRAALLDHEVREVHVQQGAGRQLFVQPPGDLLEVLGIGQRIEVLALPVAPGDAGGHQRLQRSRPAGYQKEVPVSHEVETEELVLRWLAQEYGVGFTALDEIEPDKQVLSLFPVRLLLRED